MDGPFSLLFHEGHKANCQLKCMTCGHPCHEHRFSLKCEHEDGGGRKCSCKGFAKIVADPNVLDQKLISCVMITQAHRLDMARRAIACFEAQTYPLRELIIVGDEDLSALGRKFVRVQPGLTLGELRNIGISHAKGAFVAQWDDDDWYHPERLSRQMNLLLKHPDVDGCTLARWTLAWPSRSRYAISCMRWKGWEGSILARRWRIPCYPALRRKEDTPVITNMNLVHLDEPDLYVYVVHGNNTWDVQHFESMFAVSGVAQLPPEKIAEIEARLGTASQATSSTLSPAPTP